MAIKQFDPSANSFIRQMALVGSCRTARGISHFLPILLLRRGEVVLRVLEGVFPGFDPLRLFSSLLFKIRLPDASRLISNEVSRLLHCRQKMKTNVKVTVRKTIVKMKYFDVKKAPCRVGTL